MTAPNQGFTAIDIAEREYAISFREKRIKFLDSEIERIRDQQEIMRGELREMMGEKEGITIPTVNVVFDDFTKYLKKRG